MSMNNPTTNGPVTDDPDAIRAEIERTRAGLSRDVNALGESVTPGHVAQRQVEKVKGRASRLREHVMGSASDTGDRASEMTHGVSDAAQRAGQTMERRARGNPLAAGLVALAAGWLVGSLLPASERERALAESARDHAQPLLEEAQSVAKDVATESADHLKQPAQDAVESVKDTARSATEDVKQEGQQAASDVRDSATDSAASVKQQTQAE